MKPNIKRTPIQSSQIESLGHDGDTLAVAFRNGGVYHYHGVSAEQYAQLLAAESAGSYLHKQIKPNHKFTRIA